MGIRPTIQSVSTVVALIGIAGWVRWARVRRDRSGYAFAPVWYLIQVIAYYLYVFRHRPPFDHELLTTLSAILRLEGVIILAGSAFIMTYFALLQRKRHNLPANSLSGDGSMQAGGQSEA